MFNYNLSQERVLISEHKFYYALFFLIVKSRKPLPCMSKYIHISALKVHQSFGFHAKHIFYKTITEYSSMLRTSRYHLFLIELTECNVHCWILFRICKCLKRERVESILIISLYFKNETAKYVFRISDNPTLFSPISWL